VYFILIVVQTLAGIALKASGNTKVTTKAPKIWHHPIQSWIHVALGLAITGLGFYQVWTGFAIFSKHTQRSVPLAVPVIWGGFVGITIFGYFGGLALLPYQFKKEAADRQYSDKTHYSGSGTGNTAPISNETGIDDSNVYPNNNRDSMAPSARTSISPLVRDRGVAGF